MFGMNKEKLQNLLIFKSSDNYEYVTLKEYIDRMGDQKEILYVVGEDLSVIKCLPKMEALKEKNREVLILTDKIDEFVLKTLVEYDGKSFKSISDSDFKLDDNKEKEEEIKKIAEDNKSILDKIKDKLTGKIVDVELSSNLGTSASALLAKGHISLEMEKVLSHIPGNEHVKAEKILALNPEHPLFKNYKNLKILKHLMIFLDVLYTEALIMEGFHIENPVEFIKN